MPVLDSHFDIRSGLAWRRGWVFGVGVVGGAGIRTRDGGSLVRTRRAVAPAVPPPRPARPRYRKRPGRPDDNGLGTQRW